MTDPRNWHEGQNTPVSTPSGLSAGLEGQDATQEPHDATEAAQGRVERYAEAIYEADAGRWPENAPYVPGDWDVEARAVIAVADQEQAELRLDVEHLLQDKRTLSDVVTKQRRRAEAAEARVAELEATLARVRTLTSHLHTDTIYAGDLRAILDPPAP